MFSVKDANNRKEKGYWNELGILTWQPWDSRWARATITWKSWNKSSSHMKQSWQLTLTPRYQINVKERNFMGRCWQTWLSFDSCWSRDSIATCLTLLSRKSWCSWSTRFSRSTRSSIETCGTRSTVLTFRTRNTRGPWQEIKCTFWFFMYTCIACGWMFQPFHMNAAVHAD